MKVLVVGPGSEFSISEVVDGITGGLRACGHEVLEYDTMGQFAIDTERVKRTLRRARMGGAVPTKKDDPRLKPFFRAVREETFKDVIWRVMDEQCDWLVLVSPLLAPPRALAALSQIKAHTAMIMTESPYDDHRQLLLAEFSHLPTSNDRASAQAQEMDYLPMAYSPELHQPRAGEPTIPVHDVVFVGVGFPERIRLLESTDWTGINLGLYGDWVKVADDSPLRPFIHQGVIPNTQAVDLYKNSLVGLNMHRIDGDYYGKTGRVVPDGWSVNPRAYELAACGVPQVSDWRPGLVDVFGEKMGHEMAIDTGERLGYSIRKLLGSAALRARVADEQQEAVIGRHSYHQRAAALTTAMLQAQED